MVTLNGKGEGELNRPVGYTYPAAWLPPENKHQCFQEHFTVLFVFELDLI